MRVDVGAQANIAHHIRQSNEIAHTGIESHQQQKKKSIMEQIRLITALMQRGLLVDVGVQANIAELDRSRATYAEAEIAHTGIGSHQFGSTTATKIYSCFRVL